MDAKLLYWTGALLNMGILCALAWSGVSLRRRGDVAGHRRRMLAAGSLVLLFLGSYVFKLALLGREEMEVWSRADVWVLRFHESCVLAMLLAGGWAARLGRRLRGTRHATGQPGDPPAPAPLPRSHRTAGWTAVVAAGLGLLSAGLVLLGMYRRAGWG